MQPCQVCGSVTVDQNGYCTQCRTFRGQPVSGVPWTAPQTAPPYPFSGPPVSGQPGRPASAPPASRRALTGVLIAGSTLVVLLVGAIVVVAIVRSGKHQAG